MPSILDDQLRAAGITDDTLRAVRGPERSKPRHQARPMVAERPVVDAIYDRPIESGRCECLACRCKRRG